MAGSGITAKAKAVYGTLLKKSDYDSLIQRSSVSAVTTYLKNTPAFRELLSETDESTIHRGQLENILNEHTFRTYMRLRKFSQDRKNAILDFYLKKTEAEQVIKLITAIASGNQQSFFLGFPAYLMDYLSFDAAVASGASDLKELAQILSGIKMYRPLIPYLEADEPDINKCIIVVNSCFIGWAFSVISRDFKGRRREKLKEFFMRRVDMDNVLLCYRLKKFFDEDEERIKELIIPFYYRVKPADIDAALRSQTPTDALIKLMCDKCVPRKISVDENFPELAAANAHYDFFRHRLALTCDETESMFAISVLLETQRMNLQKIIEGIRYGEAPYEIEKLIII